MGMKVSVIMAARDEDATIAQSIESLLNQTYKDLEIIVVNDGSTDNTLDIAKRYSLKYSNVILKNIKYMNKGCVRPRYIGIENTDGEIIFVVDADAIYAKDYVERCVSRLKDKGVGGVIGKIRVWNPKTFISKYRDVLYRLRFDDVDNIKREINQGKLAAWMFRREDYVRLGKYDRSLAYGEDRDFARRLLDNGLKIVYEPRALWYHRWKEYLGETVLNNFEMGQQNYGFSKGNFKVWLKVLYFLSAVPVALLSFVYSYFVLLLVLHPLPLFLNGVRLFRRAGHLKYRYYALLGPVVSYVYNIPYAFGFLLEFLRDVAGVSKF